MITISEVEQQLKDIGVSLRLWGRSEMLELTQIIVPGEVIKACLNGRYEGGFAMLCATNHRLLLIDKKPFHLNVEDMRYDMISEVNFNAQLYNATLRVCTPTKTLKFMSFKPKVLRALGAFLQQRVMDMRQQYSFEALQQQMTTMTPQQSAELVQSAYMPPVNQPLQEQNSLTAAIPTLPTPAFRNPYTQVPLMMRRRVGRFITPLAQQ